MRVLCRLIALLAVGMLGVFCLGRLAIAATQDGTTAETTAASAATEPDETPSESESETAQPTVDLLDQAPVVEPAPLVKSVTATRDTSTAREIPLTLEQVDMARQYDTARQPIRVADHDGCDCCVQADYCWRVFGTIAAGTGSSSFADNEYQLYELNQELTTPGGSRYLFYQRYRVEHTYLSYSELTLGARQHLRDWAMHGDLRMTQEYREVDDKHFDANDRQEGLFDLRFNPRSADGRTRADISYRYNVRAHETFSPLSYKMHRGRVRLEREFSPGVTGGVTARLTDYNYSLGSDRDNHRRGAQVDLRLEPNRDVTLYASVETDEKTYEVRRQRDFEELRGTATLRWRPDNRSRFNARIQRIDHDRPFAPDRSYDDQLVDLNYQRRLNEEWDVELRGLTREKRFGDPTGDLDQRAGEVTLTHRPSARWSLFASLGRDDYDYAYVLRSFTRDRYRLGAQYYGECVSFGAELERMRNAYGADPNRDWTRDTLRAHLDYRQGRHEWRLYGQLALLEQSHPMSLNNYDESIMSAQWVYKLDCQTDFVLSYDNAFRNYAAQEAIRHTRIEGRLRFEL